MLPLPCSTTKAVPVVSNCWHLSPEELSKVTDQDGTWFQTKHLVRHTNDVVLRMIEERAASNRHRLEFNRTLDFIADIKA